MHVTAAEAFHSSTGSPDVASSGGGLPFALSRPWRPLQFPWARRISGVRPSDMQVEVDAMLEGTMLNSAAERKHLAGSDLEELLSQAQADCAAVVPLVLAAKKARRPRWPLPALASVSLVLCDDAYIQSLNAAHRGKDAPTDVLSFEVPDEPGEVPPPVKLLGDLVVSLDTAARQADERGHSLLDELRVLLVHGCLHLAGFDHEQGGEQMEDMAATESSILQALGWKGQGLIEAAVSSAEDWGHGDSGDEGRHGGDSSSDSSSSVGDGGGVDARMASGSQASTTAASSLDLSSDSIITHTGGFRSSSVRLVALDMDGTLLDSSSRILPSSALAIRAALERGVRVILATGKARPAAIAACRLAGLAGDGLVVSPRGPGVFLQGLAVHGTDGRHLSDAALPAPVVSAAFDWAGRAGVSCVAFLGDECATLRMTPELEELHQRYYEPLASVAPGVEDLLSGPPVRKLLFMSNDAGLIRSNVLPHWSSAFASRPELAGAELMQAVPTMLEVVPSGVNKWEGLRVLLNHMGMTADELMAVGDGGNDAEMVRNAGIGVAMSNAVAETLAAASVVVGSNDEGGVAHAFERFVL